MRSKRLLIVLPSPMMARNFLGSDAPMLMSHGGMKLMIVSPNAQDKALAEKHGASWTPYFHPRRWREATPENAWQPLVRAARYARYVAGLFLHMTLTYRFNTRCRFAGFQARLRQSWSLRKIYLREGLPMSRLFGFPFAASIPLYKLLHGLYFSKWQSFEPVNRMIAEFRPDAVILSMVQTHMVTPYALAARRYHIPVFGINGSWDQPTTKGPLCPGVKRIAVQNHIVRDELVRFHDVPKEHIAVIGWLQMDAYVRDAGLSSDDLATRVGIPHGHRYILFAANAPRLGLHEPALFREFAARVAAGEFGDDITLVCRCHPQDHLWETRWGWTRALPKVVLEPPDLGPLNHLAAMIRNAGVVIASAGSINLDAVALDTPTIGLAWEDTSLPYWDRPARAYDLEHLVELRTGSGMTFAADLDQLAAACKRYLDDPSADAAGREQLRQRYLYRLDGGAAARLVNEIKGMRA